MMCRFEVAGLELHGRDAEQLCSSLGIVSVRVCVLRFMG
jgi:hypothetical protein